MSTSSPELSQFCKRCSQPLAPGALACEYCHALVHAGDLERYAAQARAFEANGQMRNARERWAEALEFLPPESNQAVWIRSHIRELGATIDAMEGHPAKSNWVKKLGPLGTIALLLAKGQTFLLAIFKLKFLLSFGAFIAVYWGLFGKWFGIGFAILILIHEMGHFIDIKRRGLPAEMPVFLPGLGAYVRWNALGIPLTTRAAVSLAGPFAGMMAAAICGLAWVHTGNQLWAALARASAWLNVLNLIPVLILDGGQAAYALSKAERLTVLLVAVVLGVATREGVFFFVAAGAAWRLFTKDAPAQPSPLMATYFVAVLTGLGMVIWMMPGHGF
ncbi:MAG: site-2 protease family protein [Candidatus Angelobacter sp. Gp1-AA117]|nr:MAG: site-2 protease family protein [Candidatus Angelobacter sp. Gp1-AA117]